MDVNLKRQRRKRHIRKKVIGTSERPRLVVNRTNRNIYAQVINDEIGITLASASDLKIDSGNPIERAEKVGEQIAEELKMNNITKVVFDRAGYKYHGRVKSLAEGARKAGLDF